MPLQVACNSCSKKFKADEKLQGKTVKCPSCAAPITIAAPAAPDIADLLDDEPQLAPPEEQAAAQPKRQGRRCRQCGDELPDDTRYCLVCGCNNFDVDARVGQLALELDKREQRLEEEARPRHWLLQALFSWTFWR